MLGRLAFNELSDGVFDDVVDDVFRRVIDATGLADFGLFLQPGAFVGGDDDLAEKAFVDAAEDVDGDGVEIVGRIEMGKAFADAGEAVVIQLEAGRVEDFVLFIDDAVVDAVEKARASSSRNSSRSCRNCSPIGRSPPLNRPRWKPRPRFLGRVSANFSTEPLATASREKSQ